MISRRLLGLLCASSLAGIAAPAACAEGAAHHWSYGGETGPTHWAALEPEFGACRVGHAQSPIDIRTDLVQKANLPAIEFAYRPSPLKIVDNGHTIQVNYAPGSFIDVDGHRYQLVQFHFHKPSEESIDGRRREMVAPGARGRRRAPRSRGGAADSGGHQPHGGRAVEQSAGAQGNGSAQAPGVQIDAADLLPADHAYYTFAGSLTTPPCSEGVTWFVLQRPSTLSSAEIDRFAKLYPMNARPLQPANKRLVRASQ